MASGTVVVTGAAGYVGGRLVGHLVEHGADVTALVREGGPTVPSGVDVVTGDLTEDGEWRHTVEKADAVIHLAAPSEVDSAREPDRAMAVTIAAARRVATAAAAGAARRLVLVSTVHVYGPDVDGRTITVRDLPEPRRPYAVSRLAAEHVAAGAIGEAQLVVLRLSNSVGAPHHPAVDRWTLLVPDLCRQAITTGRLVLRTDGLQWRDWIPLTDVCRVLAGAAEGRLPPGRHHLASGEAATVRSVAELVADATAAATGVRPLIEAPDPTGPSPPAHHFDVTSLEVAGLAPATSLADAVAETVEFCVRHRDRLAA